MTHVCQFRHLQQMTVARHHQREKNKTPFKWSGDNGNVFHTRTASAPNTIDWQTIAVHLDEMLLHAA